MRDIKDAYQCKADEIAQQRYSREFYDLSPQLRYQVWFEAERAVMDDIATQADLRRDGKKEKPWDELELQRRLGN